MGANIWYPKCHLITKNWRQLSKLNRELSIFEEWRGREVKRGGGGVEKGVKWGREGEDGQGEKER